MTKPKVFRILSSDGGGIRGILPAIILSEIEIGLVKEPFEGVMRTLEGAQCQHVALTIQRNSW